LGLSADIVGLRYTRADIVGRPTMSAYVLRALFASSLSATSVRSLSVGDYVLL